MRKATQSSDTAIGAALQAAGVGSSLVQFDVMLSKLHNLGFGRSELLTIFDKRFPVEGDRSPVIGASNGRLVHASGSFRGDGGQAANASSGHRMSAPIVREPTAQQRAASRSVGRVAAITIMDTLRIDGRPIGDWTVAEARRAAKTKTREGYILMAATRTIANAAGNEKLRDVVKPHEMQRITQKAAEVADAL